MDELRLGIYVPSCGRAKTTNTYKLIDDCTYVVRKSEDDELIDNYVKVSNYINDNSEEDIIFTIDDDVDAFLYRLDKTVKIEDKDIILSEIERIAKIMVDLNIGFGAEDAAITPWNYVSEFTFKGTTGAMRWYNKKAYKSRYDEKVYHNCDLDVMLHELLVNRIILRPMYFCVDAKTDTNEGGNSSKTRQEQIDCVNEMKRRWGRHFDYNFKNNKPKISVER